MMGLFFAAQAERFASGMPTEQFAKIARKEIKHKLWSIKPFCSETEAQRLAASAIRNNELQW